MAATCRPRGRCTGPKGIIWWARDDAVWLSDGLPVKLAKNAGTASAAGTAVHLSCLLLNLLQGSDADLLKVPTGERCRSLLVLSGLAGLHGGGGAKREAPCQGSTGHT